MSTEHNSRKRLYLKKDTSPSINDGFPQDTSSGNREDVKSFINSHEKAIGIIRRYTYMSSASGFIPFPGAEIMASNFIQVKMISELAGIYNIEMKQERLKSIVASLSAAIVSGSIIYGPITSVLAVLTGLGYLARSTVAVSVSGASTYTLGIIFLRHFESGGSLLDFRPEERKMEYMTEYQKVLQTGIPK